MAANPATNLDDGRLVAAARDGDERAFVELTSPHRSALHTHCYRLLGSLHDADDASAGDAVACVAGDRSLRAPRARRRLAVSHRDQRLPTDARAAPPPRHRSDRRAPAPYPEAVAAEGSPPDLVVESREAVGLAFVAAMQLLPPKQRAVLVLRDVLDWSAREVAEFFDDSVPAVNSALQRARDRVAREHAEGTLARVHRPASAAVEARVMRRRAREWQLPSVPAPHFLTNGRLRARHTRGQDSGGRTSSTGQCA